MFEYRDGKFAFDLATNRFLQVDSVVYDVFRALQSYPTREAVLSHLSSCHKLSSVKSVLRELRHLNQAGFFRHIPSTSDPADTERYIEQIVNMPSRKIELYLAEACNLACKYCYAKDNQSLCNGLMSEEVARKAIDLLFARAGDSDDIAVTFFGGEPLLNKHVLRVVIGLTQSISKRLDKRVHYSMTTNATLLDDEAIDYIKRYNFGLMISIDGSKDVQDAMRPFSNGKGSFETVMENVSRLMKRRKRVTARCTLTNRFLNKSEIVRSLEDMGFTRIAVARCTGKSYRLGKYDIGPEHLPILEREDEILLDRFFGQLGKGEQIRYNPFAGIVNHIHAGKTRKLRCGVGRGCTTVAIDGSLYPCHRYVGMKKYIIGDVWKGVDKTLYAEYLRRYFRTRQKCLKCWAKDICGGCCPWYVSHEDGHCREPEDWWCEETKRWFQRSVWVYERLRTEHGEYFSSLVEHDVNPANKDAFIS